MGCSIKEHMFEIMGQPPLFICFDHGAGLYIQVQSDPVPWFMVGKNNITHPVFKRAKNKSRIWS